MLAYYQSLIRSLAPLTVELKENNKRQCINLFIKIFRHWCLTNAMTLKKVTLTYLIDFSDIIDKFQMSSTFR